MAQSSLAQVIEMIDGLDTDELKQAQKAIEERLTLDEHAAKLERFHAALLASGLVREIKPPLTTLDDEPPPIPVQGKPVSETIIEERR